MATATVRARRAGQGIVEEARRRGVDVIVMAAEEPSRVRGGSTYGGTGDFFGPRPRTDHQLRAGRTRPVACCSPRRRLAIAPSPRTTAQRPTANRSRFPRMFVLVLGQDAWVSASRALRCLRVTPFPCLMRIRLRWIVSTRSRGRLGIRWRPFCRRHRTGIRCPGGGRDLRGRSLHRVDERRQHQHRDGAGRPRSGTGWRRCSAGWLIPHAPIGTSRRHARDLRHAIAISLFENELRAS